MANGPTTSITINQDVQLEASKSSVHPHNYLDLFPDSVYNTGPDSVLAKFLNALVGPSGVGWLKKNYFDVRMKFEESGVELNQLEQFYGNPLKFARLAEERYDYEITGNLTRNAWNEIKSKDESYRNRAIDFLHGARLGGTVEGITLAAKSGLGYNVKVIENYQYLFNQHSDVVLDIDNYSNHPESYQFGTEEFVIIPDQEFSQTSVQKITFNDLPVLGTFELKYKNGTAFTRSITTGSELLGSWTVGTGWTNDSGILTTNTYRHIAGNTGTLQENTFAPAIGKTYRIKYEIINQNSSTYGIQIQFAGITKSDIISSGQFDSTATSTDKLIVTPDSNFAAVVKLSVYELTTYNLSYKSSPLDIMMVLSSLKDIGDGNVSVTGNFQSGFIIQFINDLANKPIDQLTATSQLVNSLENPVSINIDTIQSSTNENVYISDAEKRALITAVDQIRPINTYFNYNLGHSKYQNQTVAAVNSSSEYTEVVRCVTGNNDIAWPSVDSIYWIEKGIEKESPRIHNDLQHHYHNFHKPVGIFAYSDAAVADSNYLNNNYKNVVTNSKYLSDHTGIFNAAFQNKFNLSTDETINYKKEYALPVYSEPPLVTTQADYSGVQFINGIYPMGDKMQSVINSITDYHPSNAFWASTERSSGSEYLEIDLGFPKAINFISFELLQLPIDIEIFYDIISNEISRNFVSVVPENNFPFENSIYVDDELNRSYWHYMSYNFTNNYKEIPFARFVRIKFTRRTSNADRFLPLKSDGTSNEWPIFVRNLRVGRNV